MTALWDGNRSNNTQIIRNTGAVAAIKTDGSVVTWGKKERGSDSSSLLQDGVVQLLRLVPLLQQSKLMGQW